MLVILGQYFQVHMGFFQYVTFNHGISGKFSLIEFLAIILLPCFGWLLQRPYYLYVGSFLPIFDSFSFSLKSFNHVFCFCLNFKFSPFRLLLLLRHYSLFVSSCLPSPLVSFIKSFFLLFLSLGSVTSFFTYKN